VHGVIVRIVAKWSARRRTPPARGSIGSWAGAGQIEIGTNRSASGWVDHPAVGVLLFVVDLIAFLIIGEFTSPRTITCTDTACSPTPSHQISLSTLGLWLLIALTVGPVIVALALRRAIIGVVVVSVLMGAFMINWGAQQVSKAHDDRTQLCRTVPDLIRSECH